MITLPFRRSSPLVLKLLNWKFCVLQSLTTCFSLASMSFSLTAAIHVSYNMDLIWFNMISITPIDCVLLQTCWPHRRYFGSEVNVFLCYLLILAGNLSHDHKPAIQMSAILEYSIVGLIMTLVHMINLPSFRKLDFYGWGMWLLRISAK